MFIFTYEYTYTFSSNKIITLKKTDFFRDYNVKQEDYDFTNSIICIDFEYNF